MPQTGTFFDVAFGNAVIAGSQTAPSIISNCSSPFGCIGLDLRHTDSVLIKNVLFMNEAANVYAVGGTVELLNARIANASATDGAGIFLRTNRKAVCENMTITNCICSGNGGAVGIEDSLVYLTNCTILDCQAKGMGGAVAYMYDSLSGYTFLYLTDVVISRCEARIGAGVYASNEYVLVVLYNVQVSDCTSDQDRGTAVYVECRELIVSGLCVYNCGESPVVDANDEERLVDVEACQRTTMKEPLPDGEYSEMEFVGDRFNVCAYLSVTKCSFSDTVTTSNGGCVYLEHGVADLIACSFEKIYTMGNGGVCFINNCSLRMKSICVNASIAMDGGLVYVHMGCVSITNSSITASAASNNGGVFYLQSGGVSVDEVICTHCRAGSSSGIIYVCDGSVMLANSRLVDSSKGIAELYRKGCLSIEGTTISDCSFEKPEFLICMHEHDNNIDITRCSFDTLVSSYYADVFLQHAGTISMKDSEIKQMTIAYGCFLYSRSGKVLIEVCSFSEFHSTTGSLVAHDDNLMPLVTLENCQFSDCYTARTGSVLKIYGGSITGCIFERCQADWGGGAIDVPGGVLSFYEELIEAPAMIINNCSFIMCEGSPGGAILQEAEHFVMHIRNTTFTDCVSIYGGSCINSIVAVIIEDVCIVNCSETPITAPGTYEIPDECHPQQEIIPDIVKQDDQFRETRFFGKFTLKLRNCTFTRYQTSGTLGTCVCLIGCGNIFADSCTFEECNGQFGIIYMNGDTCEASVQRSTVNQCSGRCGAFLTLYSGRAAIDSCSFENTFGSDQGIIYQVDGSSFIVNCGVHSIVFDGECGPAAFLASVNGNVSIGSCIVTDCLHNGMAVVFRRDSSIGMKNCTFENCNTNKCLYYTCGGLIFSYKPTRSLDTPGIIMELCTFIDCRPSVVVSDMATDNDISYMTEIHVKECEFHGCAGQDQAGVFDVRSFIGTLSCQSCIFTNCSSDTTGGVLYNNNPACYVSIVDCRIMHCKCTWVGDKAWEMDDYEHVHARGGGAISCDSGIIMISNTVFSSCTAMSHGGALMITDLQAGASVSISQCLFELCECSVSGGAIFIEGEAASMKVEWCNFTNCKASQEYHGQAIQVSIAHDVTLSHNCMMNCGKVPIVSNKLGIDPEEECPKEAGKRDTIVVFTHSVSYISLGLFCTCVIVCSVMTIRKLWVSGNEKSCTSQSSLMSCLS